MASIPFPALDEAIDQLGSHLLRLSPEVADVLLPKRRAKLAQLFPTLTRVPAIARAAAGFADGGRAMNERLEAFDVLRELLVRPAERQSVVLAIDDVQWIDSDSRALLAHVLGCLAAAEAEAARDVYHASMLRVPHAIVWIAHDQPERARSDLQRAESERLGEGGVLEVAAALYRDVIDGYENVGVGRLAPSLAG